MEQVNPGEEKIRAQVNRIAQSASHNAQRLLCRPDKSQLTLVESKIAPFFDSSHELLSFGALLLRRAYTYAYA